MDVSQWTNREQSRTHEDPKTRFVASAVQRADARARKGLGRVIVDIDADLDVMDIRGLDNMEVTRCQ